MSTFFDGRGFAEHHHQSSRSVSEKKNSLLLNHVVYLDQRGSYKVWEINMGVCPCLEFDNIMLINCLGYDFYIYGAFEILCNSIANL